ncbi:hypothetical protein TNCV_3804461 [Trichonephila clavipes]|nr:hypothetical protein TNCV_3804461 [Trichonephila clavipes]
MSSSPVPLKTRRVGQRCTLNLSRAETSSRWCGVIVRRGVPTQDKYNQLFDVLSGSKVTAEFPMSFACENIKDFQLHFEEWFSGGFQGKSSSVVSDQLPE